METAKALTKRRYVDEMGATATEITITTMGYITAMGIGVENEEISYFIGNLLGCMRKMGYVG